MRYSDEFWMGIVALLSALLLAASEVTVGSFTELVGHYAYWLTRVLIEATLFVAVLFASEKVAAPSMRRFPVYIFAMLISLLPFTLAITSFDLIIGLPELGLNDGDNLSGPHLQAFGFELVYLLDNHMVLCVLLLLPRLFRANLKPQETDMPAEPKRPVLFFDTIEPPLEGDIYHIEAQEHYIRIVTSCESRMALYRFSDAMREMPTTLGMQVHRSHWVAYTAINGVLKDGQNLTLQLTNDTTAPVSRSFRTQVEKRFSR